MIHDEIDEKGTGGGGGKGVGEAIGIKVRD